MIRTINRCKSFASKKEYFSEDTKLTTKMCSSQIFVCAKAVELICGKVNKVKVEFSSERLKDSKLVKMRFDSEDDEWHVKSVEGIDLSEFTSLDLPCFSLIRTELQCITEFCFRVLEAI